MSSNKNLLDRLLKESPYARIAFVVGIASILLVAGLSTMVGPSIASDDDGSKKCHATGNVATPVLLPDSVRTHASAPGFEFVERLTTSVYTGDVEGRAYGALNLLRDLDAHVTDASAVSIFRGTVCGSEPGVMTIISTIIADTTDCFPPKNPACPPGIARGETHVVVVQGIQGLDGICGGGTSMFSGNSAIGFTSTYDFTFRFGKSCRSNDG